jgi:hypothetical protein
MVMTMVGAFKTLRKVTVSFILSVILNPSTWNNSVHTEFSWNLMPGKNNRHFTWRLVYIYGNISLNYS